MRTIIGTLIALTVVLGVVTPASAFDAKTFWEQQERNGR
jgi:hypothetical protein